MSSSYPVEKKEKKKEGHFLLFDHIIGYFVEKKKDVKKREKAVASLQGTVCHLRRSL